MTEDYTRQPMDRSLVAAGARRPEVAALIVTDRIGSQRAAIGDLEGEAIGCGQPAAVQRLATWRGALGLGALHRVTIAGAHYGCAVAIADREVLGGDALESQLDTARGR